MASFLGGGSKNTQTQSGTNTPVMTPQGQALGQQLGGAAMDALAMPFFNQPTQQGMQQQNRFINNTWGGSINDIRSGLGGIGGGQTSGGYDQAAGALGRLSGQEVTAGDVQSRMNPYNQMVLQAQQQEQERGFGMQNRDLMMRQAGQRKFGTRGDLAFTEQQAGQQRARDMLTGTSLQTGFNQAQQQFNTDLARQLQASGTLGGMENQRMANQIAANSALAGAEAAKAGSRRADVGMQYGLGEQMRQYPMQQVGGIANAMRSFPAGQTFQSTGSTKQGGNPLNAILGLGGLAGSLFMRDGGYVTYRQDGGTAGEEDRDEGMAYAPGMFTAQGVNPEAYDPIIESLSRPVKFQQRELSGIERWAQNPLAQASLALLGSNQPGLGGLADAGRAAIGAVNSRRQEESARQQREAMIDAQRQKTLSSVVGSKIKAQEMQFKQSEPIVTNGVLIDRKTMQPLMDTNEAERDFKMSLVQYQEAQQNRRQSNSLAAQNALEETKYNLDIKRKTYEALLESEKKPNEIKTLEAIAGGPEAWEQLTPEQRQAMARSSKSPLVSIGEKQTEAQKAFGKGLADYILDINKTAKSSAESVQSYQQLAQLQEFVKTGPTAEAKMRVSAFAQSLGIDPEKLGLEKAGPAELFDATVQQLARSSYVPGEGTLTNYERELIARARPSLLKSPEGNALLVEITRRGAERDQIMRDFALSTFDRDDISEARKMSIISQKEAELKEKGFLSNDEVARLIGVSGGDQAQPKAAASAGKGGAPQTAPGGAKPPAVQEARQAPDGNWYVQRDGKYYRVEQ